MEVFLRTQCDGWDEQKQKEMESLENKDVESATAGDDEEAEHRLQEEKERLEEEAQEGLVQQVAEDKTCGGLLLRDMPEGEGDKPMTKEEALLTVVYASRLEEQEVDRLRTAEVKILPKRERAKKGTMDIKITLEDADQILRKVWRNLEKACKQEGVKRYQSEATSVMSPVRKKPPTVFMKSRIKAREQLEEEQRTERRHREEEREKQENERMQKEKDKVGTSAVKEVTEDELGTNKIQSVETLSAPVKTVLPEQESEGHPRINLQEEEECLDSEDEASNSQLGTSTTRVKKPIWMAEEGYGRCGKGCEGCAAKCEQQGLENCHNCHLNIEKNTSSYGCHNRKACLEPKLKLVKGGADKVIQLKKPTLKNSTQGSAARVEKSASPLVQMKILQFSGKGEEEESRKREIERSPGESPPEKSKKETRIPGLPVSAKNKNKAKSSPSKHSLF